MNRKFITALILCVFSHISFADTCPSITEVKKNLLIGWNAYDSDDGTPLASRRKAAFIKDIEEFALAEWAERDHKKGAIHCYYKDHTGSALEAYLAKDNFIPNSTNKYWYQVSGAKQCAAGMDKCKFTGHSLLQQQLARK